ncbi:MAG: DUF177 domain-containing protein [Prevotella sp.]|nr:DUF177 domain-containing protein [Prevotella sp.]
MSEVDALRIDLKGMSADDAQLHFTLTDDFFAAVEAGDIHRGRVDVELHIHRTTERYFDLRFQLGGDVVVQCDRCLDDLTQAVEADSTLVVKFGAEYAEDDNLITVDETDGTLDVSWLVYEMIVLALPIKHVHAPGECNAAMTELLSEHSGAVRSSDEAETDPRWEALRNLVEN